MLRSQHCDINTETYKSLATVKLFLAEVCLPRTSWKAVPQAWASSHETSVPKVAVGPPDDPSPVLSRSILFKNHVVASVEHHITGMTEAIIGAKRILCLHCHQTQVCSCWTGSQGLNTWREQGANLRRFLGIFLRFS